MLQAAGEILYFPVWWYSAGLLRAGRRLLDFWLDQEKILGVGVWVQNIFVPMYGQRDWAGRIISFIMRFIQIIARGAVLLFWFVVVVLIFLLWVFFPLLLFLAIQAQLLSLAGQF